MAEAEASAPSLSELLQRGWDAQRKVEKGELSSGSQELKSCVSSGLQALETATHLANELSLFSTNEAVEEIATADLKYLLLPALLGDLTLQVMDSESTRLETIKKARVYLVDYLQRCKSYAITTEGPPSPPDATPTAGLAPPPSRKSLEQLSSERAARIARLKEQKQLEKKLEDITKRLASQAISSPTDEGLLREQLLTQLQSWVLRCQDHIRAVDQEVELLEGMEKMRGAPGDRVARQPEGAAPPPARQRPMKPIVITKEMLQGRVFGAGYPSLPTVSLEEFYEKTYREQVEAQRRQAAQPKPRRSEEDGGQEEGEGGEGEEEEESEESLKKAREWDDFKDENRRGWGNKKNMG